MSISPGERGFLGCGGGALFELEVDSTAGLEGDGRDIVVAGWKVTV